MVSDPRVSETQKAEAKERLKSVLLLGNAAALDLYGWPPEYTMRALSLNANIGGRFKLSPGPEPPPHRPLPHKPARSI